ncbi:MAG: hypothetical protein C4534_06530 [Gaiellales bacterium]|nr:MAG: hypothetical protein C4534_06530 [Gaiellales bacterium]
MDKILADTAASGKVPSPESIDEAIAVEEEKKQLFRNVRMGEVSTGYSTKTTRAKRKRERQNRRKNRR